MGRRATLKPVYQRSKKLWYISIPPRLSETGKQRFEYFPKEVDAKARSKLLRAMEKQYGSMAKEASPELIRDAIECDQLAQIYGFTGLKEAFRELTADLERKQASISLRELMDTWERERAADWTDGYYKNRWKPFIRYFSEVETSPISLMDEAYWRDWLQNWRKKGDYGKATYNQTLGLLRNLFEHSAARPFFKENPFRSILPMKRDTKKREIAVMSPEDAEKLLRTAWVYDREMVPYFAICLFAGLRPASEAKALQWSDIDFDEGHVRTEVTKTETVDVRYVPIEDNLRAWLLLTKRASGSVVPPSFDRRRRQVIHGYWTTKGAKVDKPGEWEKLIEWGHDITRHSYASYYEAKYRDTPGMREMLAHNMAHSSYKMFEQRYRNARTRRQAQAYWSIMPPE